MAPTARKRSTKKPAKRKPTRGKAVKRSSVKQRGNKGKRSRGRPWKKGQSGNPKGRPPAGDTLCDYLQSHLSKDAWARLVAAQCRKGSIRALTLYANRIEGLPLSATEIMDLDELIELRTRIRAAEMEREKAEREKAKKSA